MAQETKWHEDNDGPTMSLKTQFFALNLTKGHSKGSVLPICSLHGLEEWSGWDLDNSRAEIKKQTNMETLEGRSKST